MAFVLETKRVNAPHFIKISQKARPFSLKKIRWTDGETERRKDEQADRQAKID